MSEPSQDDILATFRKELTDEGVIRDGDTLGTDDQTLLRFLRARKFNLKQSKRMITDCQEWRRTVEGVGIDELYKQIDPLDFPERNYVFQHWPMWFHKTDKKGRPLNVHFFGGINMNELNKHISPTRHWQSILVSAEYLTREVLPAASRAAGKHIGQCLVVVDLKGFSVGSFWQIKHLIRSSFQVSQDYFPETMGQVVVVNAPSSFAFIWSVIKPWLAKETADKVDVLAANYRDVLLELVEEDSLPTVLGGGCMCEGGCSLSGVGPWLEGRVGWGPNTKREVKKEPFLEKTVEMVESEPIKQKSQDGGPADAFTEKSPIEEHGCVGDAGNILAVNGVVAVA